MKSNAPTPARRQALRILRNCLHENAFPDHELERCTEHIGYTGEAVYGAFRHLRALEWRIDQLCNKPPDKRTRTVLLLALVELLHFESPEAFAVVDDAVRLAKAERGQKVAGFVNAILRRALREQEALDHKLAEQSLALRSSHPDWLVNRWSEQFPNDVESMCLWAQQPPDCHVRIVPGCEAVIDAWRDVGIDVDDHPIDNCHILRKPGPVTALPGFEQGAFYIQDASTTHAPRLLNAQPGERILDACAAPGGKSVILAEGLNKQGTLIAADLHRKRVNRIRENLKRMGHTAPLVHVDEQDATKTGKAEFHGILLDVPCSNSGVLRRRPDAKHRLHQKRLQECTSLQAKILDAAWTRLLPGGRLIYSTCSVEPEETEDQIQSFLTREPNAKKIEATQCLPGQNQTDGAYICRLDKTQ